MDQGNKSEDTNQTQTTDDGDKSPTKPASQPITISKAYDFDPYGDGSEKPSDISKTYDNNPGTYWQTDYYRGADFGNLKPGLGIILDLGKVQQIGKMTVSLMGDTSVELLSASSDASSKPTSFGAYTKVAGGSGESVTLTPNTSLKSRYLLIWLTKLPLTDDGNYRARVADIKITS